MKKILLGLISLVATTFTANAVYINAKKRIKISNHQR